ncbi:MAG TPA: tRNA glutamyl-Q(34) synthetase GluQRS [Povalibacter sp.]|nr:tRNA glutamyl-Q(34) synthetase GluQRS [Povalibacter sp.]
MPAYRGRFAPSPTGPLHFGSLVAAVASYLAARQAGGEWLVRIEDLDPPREQPGSADQIVAALARLGFEWNESIVRQSTRRPLYEDAVQRLLAAGDAFRCSCSRAEIQAAVTSTAASGEELRYPGWCRAGIRMPERATAVRFRTPPGDVAFQDQIQGVTHVDVAAEVGDFVIQRRDGWFAYQLAVVVDDAAQGITHVVRGADLLRNTPRQLLLQQALGVPHPAYAHVPVATDRNGVKLSKSEDAAAIDLARPNGELWRALRFLQQDPPRELLEGSLAELWNWAIVHWTTAPIRGMRSAPVTDA